MFILPRKRLLVMLLAMAAQLANAGYSTCNGNVVPNNTRDCGDGTIPMYHSGANPYAQAPATAPVLPPVAPVLPPQAEVRPFSQEEREQMHQNDINAGRVEESMSNQRPKSGPAAFIGTWRGINGTPGELVIHRDGTYDYSPHRNAGRYRVSGNTIQFTGVLSGWDNGRAELERGGVIEFYWTNGDGSKNAFWFSKID